MYSPSIIYGKENYIQRKLVQWLSFSPRAASCYKAGSSSSHGAGGAQTPLPQADSLRGDLAAAERTDTLENWPIIWVSFIIWRFRTHPQISHLKRAWQWWHKAQMASEEMRGEKGRWGGAFACGFIHRDRSVSRHTPLLKRPLEKYGQASLQVNKSHALSPTDDKWWATMLLSLLHAKEQGFSTCKFHQFLETTERLWCLLQPEQRTEPQAAGPVGCSLPPLGVFLVVSVRGNEIPGSLSSGNTAALTPTFQGLLVFREEELGDHLPLWLLCYIFYTWATTLIRKEKPFCPHRETHAGVLFL